MTSLPWANLFGPIGTAAGAAYNFATNPAARQDVANIFSPNWQQGLIGTAGTLINAPEYGVSETRAAEPAPYDYSQAQSTPMQSTQGYPNPTPTGTGQVAGTSTTGTTGTTGTDPLSALYAEIDNIYNSTMSYLGGQEQSLRANQPGVEADIGAQYGATRKSAETEKGVGERELATAGTAAGQRKEDALTAGRRLFGELQMGRQQRFGGASSAGQAYGELTGREFQRGQATTQQAYQNAMTKVTELGANLRERFDSAIFNLETQKNSALNQVRQTFQERLSQIDALRAEAGQNKSTMRLDLLSELRNQVYQINLASVQTQTQLNAQKQNAEQELAFIQNAVSSAQTGAGEATNTMFGATTTSPTTQNIITSGNGTTTQTPTGPVGRTIKGYDQYGNPIY